MNETDFTIQVLISKQIHLNLIINYKSILVWKNKPIT